MVCFSSGQRCCYGILLRSLAYRNLPGRLTKQKRLYQVRSCTDKSDWGTIRNVHLGPAVFSSHHPLPVVQWGAALCASLAGTVYDVSSPRIPNWLTLTVLAGPTVFSSDPLSVVQWGAALCASLAGAVYDVSTHRIPNWLTLTALATGLVWAGWTRGASGLADSGIGCLILASPYILLFVIARGGAGDAKMMGALGAWLGVHHGAIVLAAVCISGMVLGIGFVLLRRYRRAVSAGLMCATQTASGDPAGRQAAAANGPRSVDDKEQRMPYGPAIFLGVCLAAAGVKLWSVG